ncbi:MAG: type II toxin-antitoxin system VapC family toxin [Aggregatilineales bacterium]
MKYSLDTNTCIRYLNERSAKIRAKLPTIPASDIVVCSVVRAELFYGSAKGQSPEQSLEKQLRFLHPFPTVAFDDLAAKKYGEIRADLEKLGMPIGAHDLLIAAIALAHNLILVTHNVKEFSRIGALQIEDWEA